MSFRVFTLPEVAEMTGISLRAIERGCRAGLIEHTRLGAGTKHPRRGMTEAQINKLIASHMQAAAPEPVESPAGDFAAVVANARRQPTRTRRRAA